MILICGETARGKDTFARYLMNTYGCQPVVSYATRPMRQGETQGKEHYFISKEKAHTLIEELKTKNELVAYTKIGDIEYFADLHELQTKDIYIIDPKGIEMLKQTHPELDYMTVYITTPDDVGRNRAFNRGDDAAKVEKRMEAEAEQFHNFYDYDYCYTNTGTVEQLYQMADSFYKYYKYYMEHNNEKEEEIER